MITLSVFAEKKNLVDIYQPKTKTNLYLYHLTTLGVTFTTLQISSIYSKIQMKYHESSRNYVKTKNGRFELILSFHSCSMLLLTNHRSVEVKKQNLKRNFQCTNSADSF